MILINFFGISTTVAAVSLVHVCGPIYESFFRFGVGVTFILRILLPLLYLSLHISCFFLCLCTRILNS
uniref:Putative secreted peptide n=1 Tax=Anopheles braziliensis TaxID=58242 RepID=A0A2M3ZN83_9DIPT